MSLHCCRLMLRLLASIAEMSPGSWVALGGAAVLVAAVLAPLLPTRHAVARTSEATVGRIASSLDDPDEAPDAWADIPADVREEIVELSRAAERSVEEVVREAVRRHREELVDAGLIRP